MSCHRKQSCRGPTAWRSWGTFSWLNSSVKGVQGYTDMLKLWWKSGRCDFLSQKEVLSSIRSGTGSERWYLSEKVEILVCQASSQLSAQPPAPHLYPELSSLSSCEDGDEQAALCAVGTAPGACPASQCWEGSAQGQGCPAPVLHGLPSLTPVWASALYPCSSQGESYSTNIIKCRDQALHGSLSNLLDAGGLEKPHSHSE